jgi:hypothetical protein
MRIFEGVLSACQYMAMAFLYILAFLSVEYRNPAMIFWLVYVVVPLLDDYIPWRITNPTHEEAK